MHIHDVRPLRQRDVRRERLPADQPPTQRHPPRSVHLRVRRDNGSEHHERSPPWRQETTGMAGEIPPRFRVARQPQGHLPGDFVVLRHPHVTHVRLHPLSAARRETGICSLHVSVRPAEELGAGDLCRVRKHLPQFQVLRLRRHAAQVSYTSRTTVYMVW